MNAEIKPQVGVIMGSKSDSEVMERGIKILEELEIPYEKGITSAHRTTDLMVAYAKSARDRGIKVIIAGAGGSAHLPGMVSSEANNIPVIGVPMFTRAFNGLDSLLSIGQMPRGVPVAAMPIDGAENAALYAAQILALNDNELFKRLQDYRRKIRNESLAMGNDYNSEAINNLIQNLPTRG